jgi:hypothetical protein
MQWSTPAGKLQTAQKSVRPKPDEIMGSLNVLQLQGDVGEPKSRSRN